MPKTIEAIYKDGVLKPLDKLDITEHQRVKVSIISSKSKGLKKTPKPIKDMIKILHGSLPVRTIKKIAQDSEVDID